ncbi:MAG: hypothetical protein EOM26_00395 [Alphaproteobacteria bacterium]|nr:hypothetical protein [Alphaproteobacteria bacterium]
MEPRQDTCLTGNSGRPAPLPPAWTELACCSLDISLGNRYEQGGYLASIIHWINRRFERCIVNLGDTLHRHNLAHGAVSMETARERTRRMGDEWLQANNTILSDLSINYEIVRSDDWLNHPEFGPTHEALWEYYYTDSQYRALALADTRVFLNRKSSLDREVLRRSSLNYLLEETTADIIMGRREPVAHLYPGRWHESYFHLVRSNDSLPRILLGLERCAFKRISPSKIAARKVA